MLRRLPLLALLLASPALAGTQGHLRAGAGVTPTATLLSGLNSGTKSLVLNGSSGTYASTPDAAVLDITSDVDIRVKAALVDWTPSGTQGLVDKFNDSTTSGYRLILLTAGTLRLDWGTGSANVFGPASSVATGVTDGATKCVRSTLDVDDGAGNRVIRYYTSDDCTTWTLLGTAQTTAGTTTIGANVDALEVGRGSSTEGAIGRIYSAEARNGIDGTVVAKFDATDGTAGATSFASSFASSATGETWTLNGAAHILSRDLTCDTGETLTFTRPTVGPLCAAAATSGSSGDNANTLWEPAANQGCFSEDLGVRVVGSIKNELCGSETLNDSQAGCDWLPTLEPATVTLNQADSPLVGSDSLMDAVSDGSAATAERIRQTISTSTQGRYRFSIWLKAAGAQTSTLQVEADTSPTPTAQTCDVSVDTTNKRFDCTLDASALTFTSITVRLFPVDNDNVTLTGSVNAWGAQLQGASGTSKSFHLLPYCRSLGTTSTTCNADVLTANLGAVDFDRAGEFAADIAPLHAAGSGPTATTGVFVTWGNSTASNWLEWDPSVASIRSNHGGGTVGLSTAGWGAYQVRRIAVGWGGGTLRVRDITSGTIQSGAYDGDWGSGTAGDLVQFNSVTASDRANAFFKNVRIYSKPKANP